MQPIVFKECTVETTARDGERRTRVTLRLSRGWVGDTYPDGEVREPSLLTLSIDNKVAAGLRLGQVFTLTLAEEIQAK